ncbi:MAG: ImmA/IrrE family metallo-endopeptidase [Streptococcaceae bacterium]|jgi:Zn-dependent peptidase ImmA (M78 family)|nr:ImmA/IrrE family metallo-endopeptidase [Streptococcaceae bacterium]
MIERLKGLAKKHGIVVFITPMLDNEGYADVKDGRKYVFINANLSIPKQEYILCHELGHLILKHDEFSTIYHNFGKRHLEHEADTFAISQLLMNYLEETPEEYWNYNNFMEHHQIENRFEFVVKEDIKDFCLGKEIT